MRLQNVPKIVNRGMIALAFALLVAPWALAQEYRILHADYGWRDNRVDVTSRLRELARDNDVFRMGNSTFGVDPAPGHVKSLRIFTQGPNGGNRTFEYREGSTVDGRIFSGWRGGDWGDRGGHDRGDHGRDRGDHDRDRGHSDHPDDGYVILRAYYGIPGSNVDVTQRLRQLARADLVFRMGNSTFGIDPAHGVVKTLRIWAKGPGGVRMFEYREGSTVDGNIFSGWRGGDWGRGDWHGDWNGERGHH